MIVKEGTTTSVKKQSDKLTSAKMDFKCPLCLENLADDINFFPCKCSYQVCRFCWHRIRTNENGLCPQCRRLYSENPANFKPLTQEELAKLKTEKKKKEMQKKKEVAESRKQLANVRILQKNLVFVHGLPVGIDQQEEKYQKLLQTFKEFGPVVKTVVNNKTNYAGAQVPRASIYVTYQKISDALRAYKSLPSKIEEYEVKTSLGTTKYCSNFLKSVHCPKQDCMYLHDTADEELCFTKEQIHAGEHLSFGNQLYDKMMTQLCSKKSQLKDPIISEQEEVQPKASPVPVKDNVNSQNTETSHSPRQNNTSPQQSRLQPLFNRDSQNQILESEELQNPLGTHFVHKEFVGTIGNRDSCTQMLEPLETEEVRPPSFEILGNSAMAYNREPPNHAQNTGLPVGAHLSLAAQMEALVQSQRNDDTSTPKSLNEESSVNITHHRTVNNSEVFSHQESQKDMWPDHRNSIIRPPNTVHNHQNTNFISSDYNILNSVDSSTQILRNLSVNPQENGITHSKQPRSESLFDDLGFDPVSVSLSGFKDLLQAQESNPRAPMNTPLSPWPQRSSAQSLMAMKIELQKRKNPPPGFTANNLQPNQPIATPSYDSRQNVLVDRMVPENIPNTMRQNVSIDRMIPENIPNSMRQNVSIDRMFPENIPNSMRQNVSIDRMIPENIPNLMRNNALMGRTTPRETSNPMGNIIMGRMSPENVQNPIRNVLIDRMNPENIPNSIRNNILMYRQIPQNIPNTISDNALINRMLPEEIQNSRNNVLIDGMFPENIPNSIRNNAMLARINQETDPNSYNPQRNNILINRMSPVNVPNSFSPARTNFQVPRYQQGSMSVNSNPMLNGYSTPSVRNFTPQPNQQQAMQEMIARSISSQQLQSQNMSHSQFPRVDPNLSSPSMWNVNQSQQWMHAENAFQAQSMQDFRPASPLLNVRRLQPQLRPIQQVPARFNNPSPYSDNPQFIYPSAQHNQLSKETVHGFP